MQGLIQCSQKSQSLQSKGTALDYITRGRDLGVTHWVPTTGSRSRCKALDYRALDRYLGVRHWITEHWVDI